MISNWKTRRCGDCDFRIDGKCRRFPPTLKRPYEFKVGEFSYYDIEPEYSYPKVDALDEACAEIVLWQGADDE